MQVPWKVAGRTRQKLPRDTLREGTHRKKVEKERYRDKILRDRDKNTAVQRQNIERQRDMDKNSGTETKH